MCAGSLEDLKEPTDKILPGSRIAFPFAWVNIKITFMYFKKGQQ